MNTPFHRYLPWLAGLGAALFILVAVPTPHPAGMPTADIARLPVLQNGRIKPLDTVARTSLMLLRGKQTVRADGKTVEALPWLLDVMARPEVADKYEVFMINNPHLLAMFGLGDTPRRFFSFNELRDGIAALEKQSQAADALAASQRDAFQRDVIDLYGQVVLYYRLKNSVQPQDASDFPLELEDYQRLLKQGKGQLAAVLTDPHPALPAELQPLLGAAERWKELADTAALRPIPPAPEKRPDEWRTMGDTLLSAFATTDLQPMTVSYGALLAAWAAQDAAKVDTAAQTLTAQVQAQASAAQVAKAHREVLFNRVEPFYRAMVLYVLAALLAVGGWMLWPETLRRAALAVVLVAFVTHTAGVLMRIHLQGYAPVTNLYSSAVFVGWVAVLVGLILERLFPQGLGTAAAGVIGFVTLIIAHHLALSGDTMEMLRAVLDSNLWLSTHVVAVTVGYSGMFLAGLLGVFYIVRGTLTRSLDRRTAAGLARATYGVVCFSTLFSFVGTVLGGIWADQSWGRFWGWDPKENGALLIVLWCAIILHARWGGYIAERGLAVLAVLGNVVVSFSWFGTNLLGVGLHSYGFMERGLFWLEIFSLSQLLIAILGLMPADQWLSAPTMRRAAPEPPRPPPASAPVG